MSVNFGRRARIQIDDVVVDSAPAGDEKGPRIAFKIEKTLEPKPNKLEANIYNLAKKTRDRITKPKVSVTLEAGYKTDIGLLFKGDLRKVWDTHERPEVVTKLSSGDGDASLRGARFNESFGPNTKISDILLKMVDKLGVNAQAAKDRIRRGDFRGSLKEFANGFTYSGPLQAEFEKRMRDAGLGWSIQNGELLVLGDKETKQTRAVVLNASSGLLGSPERVTNDKQHPHAWKFRFMLTAAVTCGVKVVLDSLEFKGTLRVHKITHQGDTWGDEDFLNEAEGSPL